MAAKDNERDAEKQSARAARRAVNKETQSAIRAHLAKAMGIDVPADPAEGVRTGIMPKIDVLRDPEKLEEFENLVTAGVSIRRLGSSEFMSYPNEPTLWRAVAGDTPYPEIRKAYENGKARREALLEEEIEAISRTPAVLETTIVKEVIDRDGQVQTLTEKRYTDSIQHRQLLVNTAKWNLSWMNPKKHGPKPDQAPTDKLGELKTFFDELDKDTTPE